jgi:prepilin-type processing-associated H-X9-DG protein
MQRRPTSRFAFTLKELITVLCITTVVYAIVFPIFAQDKDGSHKASCLSNVKQLALGMQLYATDYDERFPPCAAVYGLGDSPLYRTWGGDSLAGRDDSTLRIPGIIDAYFARKPEMAQDLFVCTELRKQGKKTTSYMLNDLAAEMKIDDFVAPATTILFAEGEPTPLNFGHAYLPDMGPFPPVIQVTGRTVRTVTGATVREAPTRHGRQGAYYAYADGHAKYLRTGEIFFPDRESKSRSHKGEKPEFSGPDPGGDMTLNGRKYQATFHIK